MPQPLPADVAALAQAQRRRHQAIAAELSKRGTLLWGRLDTADLRGSWAQLAAQLLRLVLAAISGAGDGAQDYVTTALRWQGAEPDPVGQISMDPLAGSASDGRDLASLLDVPLLDSLERIGQGMPADAAVEAGGEQLNQILITQVQDASRVASGVAAVADRKTTLWVRMTTPPSCSRCIILAGRTYRVQEAFERHPRCDCVNVPAAEVITPPSPKALFDQMSDKQLQAAGWRLADIRAIREDGADIYQVTNARRDLRSMTVAGRTVRTTGVGAGRRALAGTRLRAGRGRRAVRLTPEAIYGEAERLDWGRDELIRQLTRHGYIL